MVVDGEKIRQDVKGTSVAVTILCEILLACCRDDVAHVTREALSASNVESPLTRTASSV